MDDVLANLEILAVSMAVGKGICDVQNVVFLVGKYLYLLIHKSLVFGLVTAIKVGFRNQFETSNFKKIVASAIMKYDRGFEVLALFRRLTHIS